MNKFTSFLIIFYPSILFAQVSIVDALPDPSAENGWSNTASTSGSYRKDDNYNNKIDLSTAISSLRKKDKLILYALSKGNYSFQNGEIQELSVMEHIRIRVKWADILGEDYNWANKFFLEGFAQHEFDQFRKLDARLLVGAGPAYHVLEGKSYNVIFGTAYLFEYLNFTFPSEEYNNRWSSYIQAKIGIKKHTYIEGVTFAQFKINDLSDFISMGKISINNEISKWLVIQLGLGINYDTKPPAGTKKLGIRTGSSIIAKF